MKDCEREIKAKKKQIDFTMLMRCISCTEVCPTMKKILAKPVQRRIGIVSGKG